MKKQINDFGEHIGGARKELYARLKTGDISSFTDAEKRALVRRKNIWETPDLEAIKNEKGVEVAYLTQLIYRAIPATVTRDYDSYVSYVKKVKNVCDKLTTVDSTATCELFAEEGILKLQEQQFCRGYKTWSRTSDEAAIWFDKKMRNAINTSLNTIKWQIRSKDFLLTPREIAEKKFYVIPGKECNKKWDQVGQRWSISVRTYCGTYIFYPQEAEKVTDDNYIVGQIENYKNIDIYNILEEAEKARQDKIEEYLKQFGQATKTKASTRKKKFVPVYLTNVIRKGEKFRKRKATGNSYLKNYKFRGGEFGNWLNQDERQVVLDYGYDAFGDLAKALGITFDSIGLGGKLAIAFGARGHGNAVAHYEPLRNVINITKLKGAGALAHEYGHALDAYIANCYNMHGDYATSRAFMLDEMKQIVASMRRTSNGMKTEFYKKSEEMDKMWSKDSHGYWHSDVEMFARLFACYIKDKLKEQHVRSDYLCGLAEAAGCIPNAEEKKILYPLVDALIAKLKNDGYLKGDE